MNGALNPTNNPIKGPRKNNFSFLHPAARHLRPLLNRVILSVLLAWVFRVFVPRITERTNETSMKR